MEEYIQIDWVRRLGECSFENGMGRDVTGDKLFTDEVYNGKRHYTYKERHKFREEWYCGWDSKKIEVEDGVVNGVQ